MEIHDVTAFAIMLKRFRKRSGLSQFELADRAGMSRNGLSDLERGLRLSPRKDTIRALSKALGLSQQQSAAFGKAAREGKAADSRYDDGGEDDANTPALSGRSEEIAQIRRFLSGDSGRVLIVSGAMGTGKTALLREAARLARADGWRILRIRSGIAPTGVPGLPIVNLIAGSMGEKKAAEIGTIAGILDAIAALGLMGTMIVIDDFQKMAGECLPSFIDFVKSLPSYRVSIMVAISALSVLKQHSQALDDCMESVGGSVITVSPLGLEACAAESAIDLTARIYRLAECLPPGAIEPCFLCAIAPSPLGFSALSAALSGLGYGEAAVPSLIEAAVSAGFIGRIGESYRSASPAMRAGVIAGLSKERRAHYCLLIAGILESRDPMVAASELATLYESAGELRLYQKWAGLAADKAREAEDFAEAKAWYQKVVESAGLETYRAPCFDAALQLTELLLNEKDFESAERIAEEAIATLRNERKLAEQVPFQEMLMRSLYMKGDPEAAEGRSRPFALAAENMEASAGIVKFFSIRAFVFYMLHDIEGMKLCTAIAGAKMPASPDNNCLLILYRAQMRISGCEGDYHAAVDILKNKLLPISEAINDRTDYLVNALNLIATLHTLGEYREAAIYISKIETHLATAAPHHKNFAMMLILKHNFNTGNWAALDELLESAIDEDIVFARSLLLTCVEIAWYRGQAERAGQLAERAAELPEGDGSFEELITVVLEAEQAFLDNDAKRCSSLLEVVGNETWKDRPGIEDVHALAVAAKILLAESAEERFGLFRRLDGLLDIVKRAGMKASQSLCLAYRALARYRSHDAPGALRDAEEALAIERAMSRPYHVARALLFRSIMSGSLPEDDRIVIRETMDALKVDRFNLRLDEAPEASLAYLRPASGYRLD